MKTSGSYISEEFSKTELEKLKYIKLAFFYESSKFLVMFSLFSFLGYRNEYLISTAFLLSVCSTNP